MKHILLSACLVFATHSGFSQSKSSAPAPQPGAPASASGFSGKVVETMNAGDYTYVLVNTGKATNWVAAPRFPVKVGDSASIAAGMPMPKYHSKTLNRDFDVVYFTERVSINGSQPGAAGQTGQLPKDHPPIGAAAGQTPALPKDHPPIGAAPAIPNLDLSGIKKAEGGKSVAEVYAEMTKLSGKQVKVRGRVVKYNSMIMGKNWLHLRDGTGKEGSNDLLVTSASDAKVGDIVVATGAISINKDFGASYKYPVMIEDAKIAVE